MGVESLTSGAPNEVCRRKRDPNTRLFLESSEFLDAKDPVLEFMFTFELKFFLYRMEKKFGRKFCSDLK